MKTICHTSAGLISEALIRIPNRRFMPAGLVQTVVSGKNLDWMNCRRKEIQGSSIAFDEEQSKRGALGEFLERYACACYASEDFKVDTYSELSKCEPVLAPEYFRYYSDEQYERLRDLNVYPLGENDLIEWTECRDYISGESCLMPAFSIYMPYYSKINSPHNYMVGTTSTGTAAGETCQEALISGFLECAERHAFALFWYHQDALPYRSYTSRLILQHYYKNKTICRLFDNPAVQIKSFDLAAFSPVECMVVFLYFRYKNKVYQSLGCAARFTKTQALIKACLEAYQGIEYAISLTEKHLLPDEPDLNKIDDFDKHFHFYNQYPQFRKEAPILREAARFDSVDQKIYRADPDNKCRYFSLEELKKVGLRHLVYKDISPLDAEELNYKIVRVLTPGWCLLTGNHSWPFLGYCLNNNQALFTAYPHPFP